MLRSLFVLIVLFVVPLRAAPGAELCPPSLSVTFVRVQQYGAVQLLWISQGPSIEYLMEWTFDGKVWHTFPLRFSGQSHGYPYFLRLAIGSYDPAGRYHSFEPDRLYRIRAIRWQ